MASRPEVRAGVATTSLAGKTAVVTGSTSGIGRELALALGRLGAEVVLHGRHPERGQSVLEDLEAAGATGWFVRADLATRDGVAALADGVLELTDTVDVLCNNAGVFRRRGELTPDGVEYTFAVNHLAPFALTARLVPALRDAEDPRVVTTSSGAHTGGSIDFQGLRSGAAEGGWTAYSQSKLANVLFTRELDRRFPDVCATCFHPGFVPGSGFMRDLPRPLHWLGQAMGRIPLVGTTSAAGAATGVYLAASPDVECGRYYARCAPKDPAPAARDEETARKLWAVSRDLAGVTDPDAV